MNIERPSQTCLRSLIKLVWASEETAPEQVTERERMIPTGNMHVVFRLSPSPIRIFDSVEDRGGHVFGCGVVAGLRSRYYVKDVSPAVRTVGAVLRPGAAQALFRAPADELAERHTSVVDLWGQSSLDLHEQLQDETSLEKQLELFESFLLTKIQQNSSIHPTVALALQRLPLMHDIREIVKETGCSHRHFIELFRSAVGIAPKLYTRLLRFQRTLKSIGADETSWIDVALQNDYSDQAHFNREFREFAGISPGEYKRVRHSMSHHVPLRER